MARMSEQTGLVFACVLTGEGGRALQGWEEVRRWQPDDGVLWIHLDYKCADASTWFEQDSGIDPIVRAALLADEPRPRSLSTPEGLLLILRVINLNAGADPEDMVSMRMWLDAHRIVSLRHRRINAAKAMRDDVLRGIGPRTAGDFVVDFTTRALDRIGRVVDKIDDQIDALEDEVLSGTRDELRHRIARLRRQAIAMRRYIAPQRDVLARLYGERTDLLAEIDRIKLREAADRLTRMVEDLDSGRDRAAVTHEELSSRLSESMNHRLYVLAVVAAIFLPLGLVTGIWGVNVGGVPWVDHPWGFWILLGGLAGLCAFQIWLFRKMRWL